MAKRRVKPKTRAKPKPTKSAPGTTLVWALVFILTGIVGWLGWNARQPGGFAVVEMPDLGWKDQGEALPPPRSSENLVPPVPDAGPPRWEEAPVIPLPTPVPAPVARPTGPTSVVIHLPPRIPSFPAPTNAATGGDAPPPATGWSGPLSLEQVVSAQLALARRGYSSGPLDGVSGSQTRSAVRAFQRAHGLPVTGNLDPATLRRLGTNGPALSTYTVTADDLGRLGAVPKSWLGKAGKASLDYETVLELIAEKAHSNQRLIRQLNPDVDWSRIRAGAVLRVPAVTVPEGPSRAAFVRISLSEKTLRAFDSNSNLLVHFPCSIARKVEKRPLGEMKVTRLAPNPNYRFDPEIFRESAEARQIGRPLMIPPGPNNPVGTAWIGLDRPGYGIHGTPNPEEVGRTESHGCFRLANWNAEYLIKLAWVGLPVYVEP